jgi:hypothetical protein
MGKGIHLESNIWIRIIAPKRDEITGTWRQIRNKELHNL